MVRSWPALAPSPVRVVLTRSRPTLVPWSPSATRPPPGWPPTASTSGKSPGRPKTSWSRACFATSRLARPSSSGTTTTPPRRPSLSTAGPSLSCGPSRSGRTRPVRPQGHRGSRLRRPGPAGRAAGLGRPKAADEGADWLRVDVWTTNERLQHYYLREGFTYVRTVVLPHNPSGALFQRPARRIPTPHLQEVERLTG